MTWEKAPPELHEAVYFSDMIAAGYPVEKEDLSLAQWEALSEFGAMRRRIEQAERKEMMRCLLLMKS